MIKLFMCPKKRYQKKQKVSEDENTTSDEDEPIDVDTTSQMLLASTILDNVCATLAFLEGELS